MPKTLKKILKEPLLHFIFIGLGLFLIYALLNPSIGLRSNTDFEKITLSPDDIKQIQVTAYGKAQRWPTEREMYWLLENKIREEVLYREALKLGLDDDDVIIKRRLAQKIEFLMRETRDINPSEKILKEYYEENPSLFAEPARITFHHIYFSPDKRNSQTIEDAKTVANGLKGKGYKEAYIQYGDRFNGQHTVIAQSEEDLRAAFGIDFAKNVMKAEESQWSDPIPSGLGVHIIYVEQKTPEKIIPFSIAEEDVRNYWFDAQREKNALETYNKMRKRYTIEIQIPEGLEPESIGKEIGDGQ